MKKLQLNKKERHLSRHFSFFRKFINFLVATIIYFLDANYCALYSYKIYRVPNKKILLLAKLMDVVDKI
jgi:hypothetical protein